MLDLKQNFESIEMMRSKIEFKLQVNFIGCMVVESCYYLK